MVDYRTLTYRYNFLIKAVSPLEPIFAEIRKALEAGLWYSAIAVASALPDICATLEGAGRTNWKTYKKWFEENAADKFSNFGMHECYELRCGVLHNGKFQGAIDKHSNFDGVLFTPPGATLTVHDSVTSNIGNLTGTYLMMGVEPFCESMIEAASEWLASNEENETVRNNLNNLVRLRPAGYPPLIVGAPVVA